MKKLITIIFILFTVLGFSQEKIKADFSIINFLGKNPYKTQTNSQAEDLLRILYFKPQPEKYPKIGFMDTKGKVRLESKYGMASDFYNGFANIIKDSIYGYIDKGGNEVLFKEYEKTYFWYSDTGVAKEKNGKFGLIDRKGNPLTSFMYNMILSFGFDHFKGVVSKDSVHLLNSKGQIVFNKDYKYSIKSDYFENDSLLIYEEMIDNKILSGLVRLDKFIVVEPKYDEIYFIEDKYFFAVRKNEKFGFINKSGVEIIPLIYDNIAFNITNELIAVSKDGKSGFINRRNEIVIPFEYDQAYSFFDGLAIVKKENYYFGINKKNKIKAKLDVEGLEFPFYSNNLIVFEDNSKYGYINKKGKIVIPAIYAYAYPFINGMAYVELYGKSGFINKNGKEIIPIKYNQLWLESEDLIRFVE